MNERFRHELAARDSFPEPRHSSFNPRGQLSEEEAEGDGQSKSVIPWFQKFFLGVPAVEDPVSSTEPVQTMQQETMKTP